MSNAYRRPLRPLPEGQTQLPRATIWLTVFTMTPALVGVIPLQSFVLQRLWDWFFTSWLHMGRISFLGAMALVLLVGALTTVPQLQKHTVIDDLREHDQVRQVLKRLTGQAWGYLILKPLVILCIGFVLHVV